MSSHTFIETFPNLSVLDGLVHGFILRHPEIDVKTDRDEALARLESHHITQLAELGVERDHLATGGQVHGKSVAVVDGDPSSLMFPDTDGLVTAIAGQFLGIYVADCGAVFIVDPVQRACCVVHSGKKGSELGIAAEAISLMKENYGSDPADLIVQVAPCIRPPAYEIDFAAQIVDACVAAGVPAGQIHDCGICTTSDPDRYYSYRMEKGKTGRLFGVIGWKE